MGRSAIKKKYFKMNGLHARWLMKLEISKYIRHKLTILSNTHCVRMLIFFPSSTKISAEELY